MRWKCWAEHAQICELLSSWSYELIPGDSPDPLSFPKGFSIATGLHLQQPSLLLSRNSVMLTNLFISCCFFLGADLLLGIFLWLISAQAQPGSGYWCLWCCTAKQQRVAIMSAQQWCADTWKSLIEAMLGSESCLSSTPGADCILYLTRCAPGIHWGKWSCLQRFSLQPMTSLLSPFLPWAHWERRAIPQLGSCAVGLALLHWPHLFHWKSNA